jgi:hypothetical protein
MYSSNGGWYSTARTHRNFGFDISINTNFSFVPSSEEIFTFIKSDYAYLSLPNNETSLETIMGSKNKATNIDVKIPVAGNAFKVASFELPEGIGKDLPFNAVPAPMVQLGLGLPSNTDIKLRIVPQLNFDSNIKGGLFGFGLQHDLMQYFTPKNKDPLAKYKSPFNISVLAAFTKTKITYNIDDDDELFDDVRVTHGEGEFKMNAWTIQAVASFDFKRISFYGALGYNKGKASVNMLGRYDLSYDVEHSSGIVVGTVEESIVDPIKLDFKTNSTRTTLGARINLGFFKIYGDYTLQEYNTLSTGIAFSFK